MNKFNDGFSNGSYDDLLEEYSGGALPGKPVSKENNAQKQAPNRQPQKKSPFPQKKNNVSSRPKRNNENSFDVDLKNAFQGRKNGSFYSNNHTDPYSTRSSGDSFRRGNRFNVNIDYTDEDYGDGRVVDNAENQSQSDTSPSDKRIISFHNKKIKFNLGALITLLRSNTEMLIAAAFCVVISIVISGFVLSCVNDVLAINRDSSEQPVEVVLPNDADTFDAIKVLDKAGLIKNSIFCNIFAKFMGFDDNEYLPGVYYLTPDMGVERMLTRFQTTATRGKLISIVIPEGFTIHQIFDRLEKNKICSADSLYKVLDTIDFSDEFEFIAKIDNKNERYLVLEGYMYPATYEFEQGADPASVIRKFLNKFDSVWTDEYSAKATEWGMTPDEIIRLASVIEKEGNSKAQFYQISSVLHNRLKPRSPIPTLDCDSTWDYIENYIYPRVPSNAERSKYEKNYWTYECAGLPAGAICNPGKASIEAALYPSASNNYYFRHDKNGKIYLAETIKQHDANGVLVDKANKEG